MFLVLLARPVAAIAGEVTLPEKSTILSAGERFFESLKAGDTRTSWLLLTGTSRKEIASSIRREMQSRGRETDLQAIDQDFLSSGPIAKGFWTSFLAKFNPDAALAESRWEIQEADGRLAILRITHKKAERPALLRLFREEGEWKIGFTESFARPIGP